jgi:uncharacterized protein
MLTEADIARIVARIVRGYAPEVVGLFGSYALGTAGPKSDLDVFVVKRSPAGPPADRARDVRRLLFGVMHHVDVHVFTPEEFAGAAQQEPYSFPWVVARQAKVLYRRTAHPATDRKT